MVTGYPNDLELRGSNPCINNYLAQKKKKEKKKGSERREKEIERRDRVEIESTQRDGDPLTHAVTLPPTPTP